MFPIAPPTTWRERIRKRGSPTFIAVSDWNVEKRRLETVLLPVRKEPKAPINGETKRNDLLNMRAVACARAIGIAGKEELFISDAMSS